MNMEQLQKENDELRAHVERLREALMKVVDDSAIGIVPKSHIDFIKILLVQTPAKSIRHIKAQVEEEMIESILELLKYEVINADEEVIGRDWRPPAKEAVDLMYRYAKSGIKTMPRKYSNQPETVAKDGE